MKRTLLSTLALAALVTAVAAARPAADAVPGPVVDSMKALHDMTAQNIMATARMLDQNMYDYQPTDEVRTAGQMLAHVASAQYGFCSAAAGKQNPNSENFEQTRDTKAAIMEALEAGFDFCAEAYGSISDERASEMITFFGQEMAVTAVLAFNTAHNYEHYGNLVTYMRINGIVPPSSGGGM